MDSERDNGGDDSQSRAEGIIDMRAEWAEDLLNETEGPVDVEIVESHLRGGSDCVIKIKF